MPLELALSLEKQEELLDRYGSPLYVYDGNMIAKNARLFLDTFRKYYSDFKQYFAVKATPNKHILKIIKDAGMGFDCSSVTEVKMVLPISDDILYSSNYTSVEDLCEILKSNVIINLDDIDGLYNLKTASEITGIKLPNLICFRLNPCIGSTSSETKSNILGGPDTKFGISDDKILDAYKMALSMGFTKFGIHVMTGSCILSIDYFKQLVDTVFVTISEIHKELGINFDFVDLGGGIGIPYRPNIDPINLELLASTIAKGVNDNTEKYSLKHMSIYMENGRYITGPYGWLLSKCKSIKIGYNDSKFYGLDACMANLMRPGMYGAYHHITIPRLDGKKIIGDDEARITDYTIEDTDYLSSSYEYVNVVGSLCENNDWFAKQRLLPKGIKKEDIFIIHDVGAHGYSMGFQYNSKLRSAEVVLEKDKDGKKCARLIRKKEHICFESVDDIDFVYC
jgi:diaminopimelate decarboxylase